MAKTNLKDSLSKLNEIVDWFDTQDDMDVEVGLTKIKEGADLIKVCKTRLAEVKNEFEEIQRELQTETPVTPKAESSEAENPEDEIDATEIPF